MSHPYRVDDHRCLHETLDGDTIVIDAERGWLVVLDGIASTIWQLMVAGSDPVEVAAEVERRYGPQAQLEATALVDELIGDRLLVPAPDAPPFAPDDVTWPATYVTPTVSRFDDVADILTMDPIHEVLVDEGWPNAPRPPTPDRDR